MLRQTHCLLLSITEAQDYEDIPKSDDASSRIRLAYVSRWVFTCIHFVKCSEVTDRSLFGLTSIIGGLIGFAFMHGFAILIESNIDTRDSLYEVKTEVMRLKNGKA